MVGGSAYVQNAFVGVVRVGVSMSTAVSGFEAKMMS